MPHHAEHDPESPARHIFERENGMAGIARKEGSRVNTLKPSVGERSRRLKPFQGEAQRHERMLWKSEGLEQISYKPFPALDQRPEETPV
jgi:hypothetical protein